MNSPLHYSTIVTRQRSMAMISVVWLTSFIMSIPVLTGVVRLDDAKLHNNTETFLVPPYEDDQEAEQDYQQYWMNLSYRFEIFLLAIIYADPLMFEHIII